MFYNFFVKKLYSMIIIGYNNSNKFIFKVIVKMLLIACIILILND